MAKRKPNRAPQDMLTSTAGAAGEPHGQEAPVGPADEDAPEIIGPSDVVVAQPADPETEEEMDPEFVRRWRPRISYTIKGSRDVGWQVDIYFRCQLPFTQWPDLKEVQRALLEALGIQEVEP